MATKIEWTDETWNPVTGCTKVSAGCKNCYAERMSKRLAGRFGYPADDPFRVTLHPDRLEQPLHWRKPRRVFVCSMGDLFHKDVPLYFQVNVWRTMADSLHHTFQVLTKRADLMQHRLQPLSQTFGVLPNVWLGVTVENQETADERAHVLAQIAASVRFLSLEPLLGPIDLGFMGTAPKTWTANGAYRPVWSFFNWVIAGCESGPGRRDADIEWFRDLCNQCDDALVPFFLKQMDRDGKIEKLPELDGRAWAEFPVVE